MTSTVSPDVLQALRSILADTDLSSPIFGDDQLIEALRVNRSTVRVRDPYIRAMGVFYRAPFRTPVPIPASHVQESILQNEPGGLSFQAAPHLRYWDDQGSVEVWVNGVATTSGYTVDYVDGRITFDAEVEDWKCVQASFSYYRIYHAARQLLLSAISHPAWANIKLGDDEFSFNTPSTMLAAIDAIIAANDPKTVGFQRQLF